LFRRDHHRRLQHNELKPPATNTIATTRRSANLGHKTVISRKPYPAQKFLTYRRRTDAYRIFKFAANLARKTAVAGGTGNVPN
jgi:hypothetical protein